MMILKILLMVTEVLCSILLIGVILIQKSKSEGLGLAFGSGMGEALFGSRAGNVLTRATIILTIVFLANTLFLGIVYTGGYERPLMGVASGPAAPRGGVPQQAAPAGMPPGQAPITAPVAEMPAPIAAPAADEPAAPAPATTQP